MISDSVLEITNNYRIRYYNKMKIYSMILSYNKVVQYIQYAMYLVLLINPLNSYIHQGYIISVRC